jgi:SAM-dependent methyltransferase
MGAKKVFKKFIPQAVLEYRQKRLKERRLLETLKPLYPRECPICGYKGYFNNFGRPPRLDALCPQCGSLERHRLFWKWYKDENEKLKDPILHFAAEPMLKDKFKQIYPEYKTADLFNEADLNLNIEKIDLDTGSVNTVICSHVFEHVDDLQALREIFRILSDSGRLVCMVPIIEGWEKTYENGSVDTQLEREVHFGQHDHVRYYGRDFRDKLRIASFNNVKEITAEGEDVVRYGLWRGEKIFVCSKL